MKEKYLVALEEVQSAINSNGSIDTGDVSWDSLNNVLELVKEQEQKIKELEEFIQVIEEFKRVKRPIRELIHEMNKFEDEFISKDKIKAIIEELEKEYEKYKGNKGLEFSRTGLINSKIQCLQSLLEEE